MGNTLFGVDIAGLIHQNISPGVLPLTLTVFSTPKINGGQDSITRAPKKTGTSHSGNGFIENFSSRLIGTDVNGEKILASDRRINIIGNSLPDGVIPGKGQTVFIENQTYRVLSLIRRDPAAAVYEVHARL